MCTLIALHRCIPGAKLVVAANRDEYLERPSEPPALRALAHGRVVAPLDVQAGGSWLGVNPAGVFAAVTNRRDGTPPDPRRRSRGLLVFDALGARCAEEAAAAALATPSDACNPFNLFVADGERAFAVSYGTAARCVALDAGPHVIGNVDLAAPPPAKVARLADRVAGLAAAAPDALLERLAELCRGHGGGAPTEDTCVHAGRYGTCSSTLLRLAERPGESALLHADGAPCRTEYRNFTHLLAELLAGRSSFEAGREARRAS
jgi:hypothetical protein